MAKKLKKYVVSGFIAVPFTLTVEATGAAPAKQKIRDTIDRAAGHTEAYLNGWTTREVV